MSDAPQSHIEVASMFAAYNEVWRQSGSRHRQTFPTPPHARRPPETPAPSLTKLRLIAALSNCFDRFKLTVPLKTLDLSVAHGSSASSITKDSCARPASLT